jgi:hypothetical protein
MERTARIAALVTALLMGGTALAVAQNGPVTAGYPVRWSPNLYYNYNYYAWPYCAPFYSLAPHYYPGDYPGAPAYRYMSWVCWSY